MDYPLERSVARVDDFIAAHPGYERSLAEAIPQGATNHVVIARQHGEPVVFKLFCETERCARECFGLRHWASTGLVPRLIEVVDATTIVMSFIPGIGLGLAKSRLDRTSWSHGVASIGSGLDALMRVPLRPLDRQRFESEFYRDAPTLEQYLGRIMSLARSVQACDEDFSDEFWKRNLDAIEARLPSILMQPRSLYHQDVGNLHLEKNALSGFFDLEMCRIGCSAMQLGAAVHLFDDDQDWSGFEAGWDCHGMSSALTTVERTAAVAAAHLLDWREITRYLSYDGTPGSGYPWAAAADPHYYRRSITASAQRLRVAPTL